MAEEERKIFIDEDWKSQVEREREQAREAPPEEAADAAAEGEEATMFEVLISNISAQALMALGLIAPEGQQQVMVDLGLAQHLIDTLDMLKEKTAGNLEEREETGLTEALSELKRAFAIRAQQAQEASMKQSGVDPTNPPPAQ